jgi:hypothetical protein
MDFDGVASVIARGAGDGETRQCFGSCTLANVNDDIALQHTTASSRGKSVCWLPGGVPWPQ